LIEYLLDKKTEFEIKNQHLLHTCEWMLDAKTSQAIEQSKPIIEQFKDDPSLGDKIKPKDIPIFDVVKQHFDDIFSLPVFSKEYCDMILDEIQNIKSQEKFKVNKNEEKDVQIQEFMLFENCPKWYFASLGFIYQKINTVFSALYNRIVSDATIQLANYNTREISKTTWHHDGDFDISMIVPLNSGEYTGGGTEFWNKGVIDPLPTGHALVFPTFSNFHRGLPVLEGDRYLFVFWLGNFIDRKSEDCQIAEVS
jgi:hypothetical protein